MNTPKRLLRAWDFMRGEFFVNVRLYKSIESINLEIYNIHLEDITGEDIRPGYRAL